MRHSTRCFTASKPAAPRDVTRSSFIRGVCYDEPNAYVLINLSGTWYHHCGVGSLTVAQFKAASSMGQYYNRVFRGHYDCRINPMPIY